VELEFGRVGELNWIQAAMEARRNLFLSRPATAASTSSSVPPEVAAGGWMRAG
jgi:hypothetical protein